MLYVMRNRQRSILADNRGFAKRGFLILLSAAGIVVLAFLYLGWREYSLETNGVRTFAVIAGKEMGVENFLSRTPFKHHYFELRFKDEKGAEQLVPIRVSPEVYRAHTAGTKVRVRYDRTNPKSLRLLEPSPAAPAPEPAAEMPLPEEALPYGEESTDTP
jgi:hypothetical protein